MKKGKDNKDSIQPSQQGTGSAEHTRGDRNEQQSKFASMNSDDKKEVAKEGGLGRNNLTTIEEMGGLSGRDDAAGGSGDRMEGENTGERTDR